MLKRRTLLVLGMIFIFMFLAVGLGYTFDANQLQTAKTTKSCPNCDLSSANLAGQTLAPANLNGANLMNANLHVANLTGANVMTAILSDATWTDGAKCKPGSRGVCNK